MKIQKMGKPGKHGPCEIKKLSRGCQRKFLISGGLWDFKCVYTVRKRPGADPIFSNSY